MNENDGSETSPTRVAARNMSELIQDLVRLTELQIELAKVEVKEWSRSLVMPCALLIAGMLLALGSVPVLLFSVASSLTQYAEFSNAASLVIATVGGFVIAGLFTWVGWLKLRGTSAALQRSREEVMRNVTWIKRVLTTMSTPAGSDCKPTSRNRMRPFKQIAQRAMSDT